MNHQIFHFFWSSYDPVLLCKERGEHGNFQQVVGRLVRPTCVYLQLGLQEVATSTYEKVENGSENP
jgi:hypothetical protein